MIRPYMHFKYSQLSLSRSRRDPLKHIEISVLRHIRFAELILVGCFGLNGPLRQYFSLYRAQREREKEKRNDRCEKKRLTLPHPHSPQAQSALALLYSRLVGRPDTGTLPSTIAPPDHPLAELRKIQIEQPTFTNKYVICYHKLETYIENCGKGEKLLLRSNFSSYPQYFVN